MHKLQLKIYLWDGDTLDRSDNWIVASKEIDVPFIPFIGLQIEFPLDKPRKIESVGWNVDGRFFTCTLEAQFCELGLDDPLFEELAEDFEENGWILVGPHPKNI